MTVALGSYAAQDHVSDEDLDRFIGPNAERFARVHDKIKAGSRFLCKLGLNRSQKTAGSLWIEHEFSQCRIDVVSKSDAITDKFPVFFQSSGYKSSAGALQGSFDQLDRAAVQPQADAAGRRHFPRMSQ